MPPQGDGPVRCPLRLPTLRGQPQPAQKVKGQELSNSHQSELSFLLYHPLKMSYPVHKSYNGHILSY